MGALLRFGTAEADIAAAAAVLVRGGLAAFPTETVYGLGADAFNTHAVARVFEVKGRPRFDPLIVHIASLSALERIAAPERLTSQSRELLEKLAAAFWPGPLTLILPRAPGLPELISAGLSTVAIRFPAHPAAQKLILLSTGAVAAPSANPFGRLSPTRAEHVIESLGEKIDCIVDGGPAAVGVESTVLDISGVSNGPRILRPGGISREALEALAGPVESASGIDISMPEDAGGTGDTGDTGGSAGSPPGAVSPGQMKSHYAPGIPLFLHSPEEMASLSRNPGEAYLFFSASAKKVWLGKTAETAPGGSGRGAEAAAFAAGNVLALSETADPTEAAANLFEYLHRLDRKDMRRIHAETLPPAGLGEAVNDRLRRAAGSG